MTRDDRLLQSQLERLSALPVAATWSLERERVMHANRRPLAALTSNGLVRIEGEASNLLAPAPAPEEPNFRHLFDEPAPEPEQMLLLTSPAAERVGEAEACSVPEEVVQRDAPPVRAELRLLSHPRFVRRPGCSSVVLTEHHTQRVLEGVGRRDELRVNDNLGLLRDHVDYLTGIAARLERMTRWQRENLANPRLSALIERFHLTHVLNYAHLEWSDVAELDRRLASVGTVLCTVTARPDELRKRLATRGPSWGAFLSEPGQRHHLTGTPSPAEQADYFIAQQDALLELEKRSVMAEVEIDTTNLDPTAAAERVLEVLLGDDTQGPSSG